MSVVKDDCPICTNKLIFDTRTHTKKKYNQLTKKKSHNSIKLNCGHYFHNRCISKWMTRPVNNYATRRILKNNPTCPVCRRMNFGYSLNKLETSKQKIKDSMKTMINNIYTILTQDDITSKLFTKYKKTHRVLKYNALFINTLPENNKQWIEYNFKPFIKFFMRDVYWEEKPYETKYTKKFRNSIIEYVNNVDKLMYYVRLFLGKFVSLHDIEHYNTFKNSNNVNLQSIFTKSSLYIYVYKYGTKYIPTNHKFIQ